MANVKRIQVGYSETGKTVYCVIERQADGYLLNDADGAFASAPADHFITMTESSYSAGVYALSESRTVWDDGRYTVSVYKQLGGSPVTASDFLIGLGEMTISLDTEISTAFGELASTDAVDIVEKAEILCNDLLNTAWPRTEWLEWLNEGQLEVAKKKPSASINRLVSQLVSGSKQTLPLDAISLVKVNRNMGADGLTPGLALTPVSQEVLDSLFPGWHSSTQGVPQYFSPDTADKRAYFTFPPSNGQTVEIVYHARPARVEDFNAGTKITIRDEYSVNVLDYMLFRAALKLDENGNSARANTFWQAFLNNLGEKA